MSAKSSEGTPYFPEVASIQPYSRGLPRYVHHQSGVAFIVLPEQVEPCHGVASFGLRLSGFRGHRFVFVLSTAAISS